MPVASAISAVGNRQRVSDNHDNHNHNHIQEVINGNNEHPAFAAVADRLEQPVNRR